MLIIWYQYIWTIFIYFNTITGVWIYIDNFKLKINFTIKCDQIWGDKKIDKINFKNKVWLKLNFTIKCD